MMNDECEDSLANLGGTSISTSFDRISASLVHNKTCRFPTLIQCMATTGSAFTAFVTA